MKEFLSMCDINSFYIKLENLKVQLESIFKMHMI
jgi:hypothetical protein